MSSRAARRDQEPDSILRERFRQASLRLREAQAGYEKFLATTPLPPFEDVEAHSLEEMQAAHEKLEAAETEIRELSAEMRSLYAQVLRNDPSFKERSDEAERRLADGPPWDDTFSPSDLLKESRQPDR